MARQPRDPFGFLEAINWDVVDEHADEILAVLEKRPAPDWVSNSSDETP